jgi:hypothetical protein
MKDLLPFGTRVRLSHVIRPVYLKWKTHDLRPSPFDGGGKCRLLEEVELDPPQLVRADDTFGVDEADIGLDLPEPSETPRGGTHRRLRRWPVAADGVAVGRTYRIEGRYHSGGQSGGWDGPTEYDPAFLSESRRLWVYEVALHPGEVGGTAWPAAVVLAIPEDVQPELSEGAGR